MLHDYGEPGGASYGLNPAFRCPSLVIATLAIEARSLVSFRSDRDRLFLRSAIGCWKPTLSWSAMFQKGSSSNSSSSGTGSKIFSKEMKRPTSKPDTMATTRVVASAMSCTSAWKARDRPSPGSMSKKKKSFGVSYTKNLYRLAEWGCAAISSVHNSKIV